MTINCPKCGLSHDVSVIKCDCGFDLRTVAQNKQGSKTSSVFWKDHPLLRISRVLFLCFGIVLALAVVITFFGSLIRAGLEGALTAMPVVLSLGLSLVVNFGLYGTITMTLSNHEHIQRLTREISTLRRHQPE